MSGEFSEDGSNVMRGVRSVILGSSGREGDEVKEFLGNLAIPVLESPRKFIPRRPGGRVRLAESVRLKRGRGLSEKLFSSLTH